MNDSMYTRNNYRQNDICLDGRVRFDIISICDEPEFVEIVLGSCPFLSAEVVDMVMGLLGKKVGMTQIYDDKGQMSPATVLQVGPCPVLCVRDQARDGYHAVQLGFLDKE